MNISKLILGWILSIFLTMAFSCKNSKKDRTDQKNISFSKAVVFDGNLLNNLKESSESGFFYDVASRYMSTMTKEDMGKVGRLADILPEEQIESIVSYHSVSVTVLGDNYETISSVTGESDVFNTAQIKLLHTAPYSTDILIRADYVKKNKETGELEDSYTTPHITIIPEKEAVYEGGMDSLIKYLKESSQAQTDLVQDYILLPGKVHFTVMGKGTISNVKLSSSCGYPSIDETMIGLIANAPGKWEPATNSNGDKVAQELVFFFGIVGC